MVEVYTFKVAFAFRRGCWRRIEIRSDQTLGDFDEIIRIAFNHDTWDHLSEFYPWGTWRSGFGEIEPFGGGSGAKIRLEELGIWKGKMGYVYDFGDNIRHIITLEKISEPEQGVQYPRIVARNKPRYKYCERCGKRGKKKIATWICAWCSEKEGRAVLLCEKCMGKHDDHYLEEIVY